MVAVSYGDCNALGQEIKPNFCLQFQNRCGPQLCFAAGDYSRMASGTWGWASAPYVRQQEISIVVWNRLGQSFSVDPPEDERASYQYVPNFVPYPLGSVLRSPGTPPPRTIGGDPALRHSPEGRRQ